MAGLSTAGVTGREKGEERERRRERVWRAVDLEEEETNLLMTWAAAEGSSEEEREERRRSECLEIGLLDFLLLWRRAQRGDGNGRSLYESMDAIAAEGIGGR